MASEGNNGEYRLLPPDEDVGSEPLYLDDKRYAERHFPFTLFYGYGLWNSLAVISILLFSHGASFILGSRVRDQTGTRCSTPYCKYAE